MPGLNNSRPSWGRDDLVSFEVRENALNMFSSRLRFTIVVPTVVFIFPLYNSKVMMNGDESSNLTWRRTLVLKC